jgi:hypothetical protein
MKETKMRCNSITLKGRLWLMTIMLCMAVMLMETGCSPVKTVKKTAKKLSRSVRSSEGDVKKRVGTVSFFNRSPFSDQNLEGILQNSIVKTLSTECGDLIVLTPENKDYPLLLSHIPRLPSGAIDNLTLAKTGRKYGLNGILTGGIVDVSEKQEERGLFWFRDTHYSIQVIINMQVYDTETGAKLFDESLTEEIEIEEADFELIKSKKEITVSSLQEEILDIADEMGDRICDAIASQPWTGYVASVVKEKIVISSGSNAGIVPGQLFEVYKGGNIIPGADGQRFFVPGEKIGEIQVDLVLPDKAVAVLVSGDGIKQGDTVRIK